MKYLKILFLIFVLAINLSLFACNKNVNSTKENTIDSSLEQDTTDGISLKNFVNNTTKTIDKTSIKVYEGPSYLKEYEGIDVEVNETELFVYSTRVNHERQFSWTTPNDTVAVVIFDFTGKVTMKVTVDETVQSAKVTPAIYGVKTNISGNTITFDLEYTANYTLEYNDDSNNCLHIFTNQVEDETITEEMAKNDPSIVYIGPGVYKADAIPTESNTTIYLAGGSYVYGQIRTEGLENVKICGRGIISGSIYNRRSESEYTIPFVIRSSKNITVEDITILDPAGWAMAFYKSEDITIDNVKIITARQNGDGISIQSCADVNVTGGFVRSWDDSLVVKNVDGGSTSNVTFDSVTIWTDLAQSMEVGYEANGETMTDITFKNIIVLHNYHKAVISMHNADDAQISNATYKNIIVEDCETLGDDRNDGENDFLIDLCVLYNTDWSKSINIKGTVKNVLIENVIVYKKSETVISRVNGYSDSANIDGVTIKNIMIEGKIQKSIEDLGLLSNQYAKNISVSYTETPVGAYINLPYTLKDSTTTESKTIIENINQTGMLVPTFARGTGELTYIGVKNSGSFISKATHNAGTKNTTTEDDGSGDFTRSDSNIENVCDNDSSTTWINKEWTGVDDEFAALTIEFGNNEKNEPNLIKIGVVRILGNLTNEFYYTYSFQVWGLKLKSDGSVNTKYTKLVSQKDYEMTPSSNNCIDVNITTQEYAGIQIRFYKNDLVSSPKYYEISEVEFYAPSLTYNKAIVDSTEHNDVYNVEKVVDGDATGTSYYESLSLPAYIVIDLGDLYDIETIVMSLPPSLMWNARSEEIEILVSSSKDAYSKDTTEFETVVEKTSYLFDPATGNRNIVNLKEKTKCRYLKIVIYSNDISAGYQAQLSEISVYGN